MRGGGIPLARSEFALGLRSDVGGLRIACVRRARSCVCLVSRVIQLGKVASSPDGVASGEPIGCGGAVRAGVPAPMGRDC